MFLADSGTNTWQRERSTLRTKATHDSQLLSMPSGAAQCLTVPETCRSPLTSSSALSQNSDSTLNHQPCTLAIQWMLAAQGDLGEA